MLESNQGDAKALPEAQVPVTTERVNVGKTVKESYDGRELRGGEAY